MKNIVKAISACVCLLSMSFSSRAQSRPTTKPAFQPQILLDAGSRVDSGSLVISLAAKRAFFTAAKMVPGKVSFKTYVVDLATGKPLQTPAELSDAVRMSLSPDGLKLAFETRTNSAGLYVLDIASGKVNKLAQGTFLTVLWFGDKVAVGQADEKRQLQKIRLFDAGKGTSAELPIRGMPAVVDKAGKVLFVAAIAKDPSAPAGIEDIEKATLMKVDGNGKVLAEIIPMAAIGSMPVIDPTSKFIAFESDTFDPKEGPGPDAKFAVKVFSIDGKEKYTIEVKARPIAVSDLGKVVTLGSVFDPNAEIRRWDSPTKFTVIAKEACAAAVVGDEVYFLKAEGNKVTLGSAQLR